MAAPGKEIRVALKLQGQRKTERVPASSTVWEILAFFERKYNITLTGAADPMGYWFLPKVTVESPSCDVVCDSLPLLHHTFRQLRVKTKNGIVVTVQYIQSGIHQNELGESIEEAKQAVLEKFPPSPIPQPSFNAPMQPTFEPSFNTNETNNNTSRNDNTTNSTNQSNNFTSNQNNMAMDVEEQPESYYGINLSAEDNTEHASAAFTEKLGRCSRAIYEFYSKIHPENAFTQAKKTAKTMIKNLKKSEDKFNQFKATHPKIVEKVMRHDGAENLFLTIGFLPVN